MNFRTPKLQAPTKLTALAYIGSYPKIDLYYLTEVLIIPRSYRQRECIVVLDYSCYSMYLSIVLRQGLTCTDNSDFITLIISKPFVHPLNYSFDRMLTSHRRTSVNCSSLIFFSPFFFFFVKSFQEFFFRKNLIFFLFNFDLKIDQKNLIFICLPLSER